MIDKLEYRERYAHWQLDPYHYGLTILVEQYIVWLSQKGQVGDVMAESRGGNEDRRLKAAFFDVCTTGSAFVAADRYAMHLTSRQLKLKTKISNIAGLQLADLIAYPSFRALLAGRQGQPLPINFGGRIAKILEAAKYNRSSEGQIEGWGKMWLP